MRVLAGDVGGTRTRLAVAEVTGDGVEFLVRRDYESDGYDGLAPVVREFLGELDAAPGRASFGLACPIVDGRCRFPNLDWEVEADALAGEIGIERTGILNDFNAVAHALDRLGPDDLETLQAGSPRPDGPVAVLGAGTGLGHAYVTREEGRVRVHSSEGGHVDLAARSPLEDRLVAYLRRRHGRASYERALSGPGLVEIYRFLVESGWAAERPDTRSALEEAGDDAPAVVSARALEGVDELCVRALDLFASIYGAQAGNLALLVQARGGVYVAGGIAPRILEKLVDGTFMRAFRAKGRFADFTEEIPVRVVVNEDAGLIGAAAAAARE